MKSYSGNLLKTVELVLQILAVGFVFQHWNVGPEIHKVHQMDSLVPNGILTKILVQVRLIMKNFLREISLIFFLFLSVPPDCQGYSNCLTCAVQSQCAWCASDNVCLTIQDAFSRDCRGLVFDPPCPSNYVAGKSPAT